MGCVDNPQQFFLFKVLGPHDIHIRRVHKHMNYCDDFVVERICRRCGKTWTDHFVDYNELRFVGFTKEVICQIDDWGIWLDENETPKEYCEKNS